MQKGSLMNRSGERTHSHSLEGRLSLPKGHRRRSQFVESGRKDGFFQAAQKLHKLVGTANKKFKVSITKIDYVYKNFGEEGTR